MSQSESSWAQLLALEPKIQISLISSNSEISSLKEFIIASGIESDMQFITVFDFSFLLVIVQDYTQTGPFNKLR